ncbi:MAG: glycosyltransferase [Desulfovibrio sp.]
MACTIGIMDESDPSALCVIIPAKNEAMTIGEIVSGIRNDFGYTVVVVDDDSSDDTGSVAEEAGAVVLTTPCSLGAWGAIQTGFRYGLASGYKQFITCDADLQHNYKDIPTLLDGLKDADVVIGSCVSRGSTARHIAWHFFRWLSGLDVADLTSGFRAYSYRAIRLLAGHNAVLFDYQDVGILLLLSENGMKIKEIEVSMCAREQGASRIFSSWWKVSEYMLVTTLYVFARRLTSFVK